MDKICHTIQGLNNRDKTLRGVQHVDEKIQENDDSLAWAFSLIQLNSEKVNNLYKAVCYMSIQFVISGISPQKYLIET
jgi:hypothetical protein